MNPVRPERPFGFVIVELARDQPEYRPLLALVSAEPDREGRMVTEWEPDGDELTALRAGGRVRLTTLTFGNPFQPVILGVVPSSTEVIVNPAMDMEAIESEARILCDSYYGEDGTYDDLRPELQRRWRDAAVAAYRARVVRARL